ncbi:MAG: DNA polymerase III subunit beta [Bacteroidales bacterium]|nr:DNA polymerase III subunit beta [Bacteroidales bacterium]
MLTFIVSSTELYEKLQQLNKVVPSKSTLPILGNFLFELNNNTLTLTATDTSNTITTQLQLQNVEGTGSICIDAKKLIDIIKEFGEQPITFNINEENKNIEITTQNGKYTLVGYDHNDFPQLPTLKKDANRFIISGEALLAGIQKTFFAIANDNLRPIMNGIYFDISPTEINFVSTDAHKLVRYKRFDVKVDFTNSFILSQKSAALLKTMIDKNTAEVHVSFDKQNAHFEVNDTHLICRLIEGVYPAYNSVIPVDNPNKLTIDRVEFMNSIKRVSIFSNPATNLVRLQLNANQITVSAQDYDLATSGIEVLPCSYEGKNMDIGFKSSFLHEILANHTSTNIIMELSDPTRAGLVLAADEDHTIEHTLMLIMPMKINTE